MRTLVFIVGMVLLSSSASGQTCTYESNFEWLKKTFEENDAGFQYIIDKKGEAAYNIHNQMMLEKVRKAKSSLESTQLFYEWLKFFRSGHIGIERLVYEATTPGTVSQPAEKTGMWKGDVSQFEKYIDTKKEADFEGIWQTGAYKIGIKKEGEDYVGFIVEADVDGWREQGQIKLKFEQQGDRLTSTFYLRNYSAENSENPELLGSNYLQIGQRTLKRLKPVFPEEPMVENYFKSVDAEDPYLEELNATTLYMRIPSFEYGYRSDINKVIAENREKILNKENLIIDLRDNGGGSDQCFEELLPFLYTNPVREISVEFLSTELNNKVFLDYSTNPDFDEDMRQWAKNAYDKLQGRLGEFVFTLDEPVHVERRDTVYEYPKSVGIIINERNASTTEQFLLAAKQSKKVKLFGVTTSGALDISNMASVESPCKEFRLWYCMSRSLRIPGMTIDDIGLQPDFYLDKAIPQHKWVEHVSGILNE